MPRSPRSFGRSRFRLRMPASALVLVLVLALVAGGCGGSSPAAKAPASSERRVAYPLTVENCGQPVTFDKAPGRLMLVNSSPVPALQELGVMDRAIARAGAFPDAYYDAKTRAAIARIPSLGEELDAKGHLQISQDVIIAQNPDLLLGLPDGITREALGALGINVLVEPSFCPESIKNPTFDNVWRQVEFYGRVFDRQDEAAAAVKGLKERLATIQRPLEGAPKRTAATLYPTVGGGTPYAYGTGSMAHPQMEAAGFTNVFADTDQRVFEVTLEELLNRDPDVLILLYVDGDPAAVKNAITSLPGADRLKAVRNDAILVQLFNFTEPPTPLVIDGLERIAQRFGTQG